jgi:hypothetical protein
VVLAAPLVAGLNTRVASPSIEVPGSSSELAARNLQQSFGVDAEPPEEDGRVPATPGLDIARALLLVLPLTAALVLLATRSLLAAVALVGIELASVIAALGLLVGLPGLAPPHPLAPGIAAAVAGGAAVWLALASPPGRAGPLVAAGVAACGFLPLLFAPIPALRGMGAAGVLGLAVAAAAAATLGRRPSPGRPRPPEPRARPARPPASPSGLWRRSSPPRPCRWPGSGSIPPASARLLPGFRS